MARRRRRDRLRAGPRGDRGRAGRLQHGRRDRHQLPVRVEAGRQGARGDPRRPRTEPRRGLDHGARDRTLPLLGVPVPTSLTTVAKAIAGVRYDLDWDRLDYVDRAGRLSVPVLLFHGTADPRLPIAPSQALAAARPDLVTFVPVAGAGHVESWNHDRARYEQATRAFLDRVAATTTH